MTYKKRKQGGNNYNDVEPVTWWSVIEAIKEERRQERINRRKTRTKSDTNLHVSFGMHADNDTVDNLIVYVLCRRTFEDGY